MLNVLLAYNAIKNKEEKEKIICAKPIMWGVNTLHENKNIIDRKKLYNITCWYIQEIWFKTINLWESNDYCIVLNY